MSIDDENPPKLPGDSTALPIRTPMFEAINAARYDRQLLIKDIDNDLNRSLICYVSGRHASIDRDDIVFLVDLLERIRPNTSIDLLLHTGGGDMDAAEKMVEMIRKKAGTAGFRVIVPDFAKSSGTLIAIAADKIVMSDTSELGPIDPQLTLDDGRGNLISHSVQAFLDAYETYAAALAANPDDMAAQIMFSKLDPGTMKLHDAAKKRARSLAERHLKEGMLKHGGEISYTTIAGDLLDTKRWLTHGQMIGPDDAKKIGLLVEYLPPTDTQWRRYWRLYCRQRLAVQDRQKLFESHYVSLPVDG
jgi:ATP-dependent protease ClpP protease subunit